MKSYCRFYKENAPQILGADKVYNILLWMIDTSNFANLYLTKVDMYILPKILSQEFQKIVPGDIWQTSFSPGWLCCFSQRVVQGELEIDRRTKSKKSFKMGIY